MKKLKIVSALVILALLIFGAFSINSQSKKAITVSGGVTSENQIIGSMIVELLKHDTDYEVKYLNNLASAQVNHVAMQRGQLQISGTRYTGTDLVTTLGREITKDPKEALTTVQKDFKEKFQQDWRASYGFSNQFAFMVTEEMANKYHLEKVSDLQKLAANMKLGVDSGWYKRQGDGYEAFTKAYNMKFQRVFPMQVGLLYDALQAKNYDVILGYSTDGRIAGYKLKVLGDDRQFFPPYTCSMVVDQELYEEYPGLDKVLAKLEGKISTETMQRLNYETDVDLVEPANVAKKFLIEHNYFDKEDAVAIADKSDKTDNRKENS